MDEMEFTEVCIDQQNSPLWVQLSGVFKPFCSHIVKKDSGIFLCLLNTKVRALATLSEASIVILTHISHYNRIEDFIDKTCFRKYSTERRLTYLSDLEEFIDSQQSF
jgi:hypothetical protein